MNLYERWRQLYDAHALVIGVDTWAPRILVCVCASVRKRRVPQTPYTLHWPVREAVFELRVTIRSIAAAHIHLWYLLSFSRVAPTR